MLPIELKSTDVYRSSIVWVFALIALLAFRGSSLAKPPEPPDEADSGEASRADSEKTVWLDSLAAGYRRALVTRQPLLVRVGGEACPWCHKLAAEFEKREVTAALDGFTLVAIDAEKSPDDARAMGVSGIPALRVVTPTGRVIASHDGYLAAKPLVEWLVKQRDASATNQDDELLAAASEPPSVLAVVRLVRLFGDRNPAIREAAIRRLRPHADVARPQVVKAFCDGNLTVQLAALEVLAAWKGPVGDLDPWRPETLTDVRKDALRKWSSEPLPADAMKPQKLDEAQQSAARADINRLLEASETEAEAICERLARYGPALLPDVTALLNQTTADERRHRLQSLRYRLLATGSLALRWPGGMARLASPDAAVRHQAVEELVELAGPEDQPLLSELFRNPDPLIREMALRALRHAGGPQATAALVTLLDDPEPNVRAAVLKQLAEEPTTLVTKIAEYVKREKDLDLVVHAIRVLKKSPGGTAAKTLVELLKHPSWQVRAESAEALGKMYDRGGGEATEEELQARLALVDLLDDADAFVVGKALSAMPRMNDGAAIDRLVGVAKKHSSLTALVIEKLVRSDASHAKAIPHLKAFARHADAAVRIAAIEGLASVGGDDLGDDMVRALGDSERKVRIAAADAIVSLQERERPKASEEAFDAPGAIDVPESSSPSILERVVDSIFDPFNPRRPKVEKKAVPEPKAAAVPEPKERPKPPEPPDDSDTALDRWLLARAAGKDSPPWAAKVAVAAEKMLASPAAEERSAAALALVALGKTDKGLPVLLSSAGTTPELYRRAAAALTWLVWERRINVYEQLLKLAGDDEKRLAMLTASMGEAEDERAADVLWKLLDDSAKAPRRAGFVGRGVANSLFGDHWSLNQPEMRSLRQKVIGEVKPRTAAGPPWQRLMAVEILLRASPVEGATAAEKLAADTLAPEEVRCHAFQFLMVASPLAERRKLAIAALSEKSACRRQVALGYLTEGIQSLTYLEDLGIYLSRVTVDDENEVRHSGKDASVIAPEPPRGLLAEHVEPLLSDGDAAVRARAGYLLALLGERRGLAVLLAHRRGVGAKQRSLWDRLAFRAIAALDDEESLPVLKEIYRQLKDDSDVKEFYWTIRVMTGPAALKFRGQVRRELGMERLQ